MIARTLESDKTTEDAGDVAHIVLNKALSVLLDGPSEEIVSSMMSSVIDFLAATRYLSKLKSVSGKSVDALFECVSEAVLGLSRQDHDAVLNGMHGAAIILEGMGFDRGKTVGQTERDENSFSRWSRDTDRISFVKSVYKKYQAGEECSPEEMAIAYLVKIIYEIDSQYKDVLTRKAILVPSRGCEDYVLMCGELIEKENAVRTALSSHGFTGRYPEDLSSWLSAKICTQQA